jgi:DNA polymerase zeta
MAQQPRSGAKGAIAPSFVGTYRSCPGNARCHRHCRKNCVRSLFITGLAFPQLHELIKDIREFARVFGVDFFSVISRGSQFKVESFMFRIAKPENFVLRSPNKHEVTRSVSILREVVVLKSISYQVGMQNAAECMPLIMEPLSAFYNSPLVVLDFQSLYPSIMVAYNYCYSTCLGRVTSFKGQYKFGVAETNIPLGLLATLQDHITGKKDID